MKRKSRSYPHSVRKSLKDLGLPSSYHFHKLPGCRKPFLVEAKRTYGVPDYNLPSLLLTLLKGLPLPHTLCLLPSLPLTAQPGTSAPLATRVECPILQGLSNLFSATFPPSPLQLHSPLSPSATCSRDSHGIPELAGSWRLHFCQWHKKEKEVFQASRFCSICSLQKRLVK